MVQSLPSHPRAMGEEGSPLRSHAPSRLRSHHASAGRGFGIGSKQAEALRIARDIRSYVHEVRTENRRSQNPFPAEDVERWAAWAHHQADAIDPVRSGAFLSTD